MPQLSLYIDQETLDKVSAAARASNSSVSKLVSKILARDLSDQWSPEFLATLGSVTDRSLTRPDALDPNSDLPRGQL